MIIMADLLDIAPSSTRDRVAIIGGVVIDVQALHLDAIAALVTRFPGLAMLLFGGANALPRLIGECGPAIGPIIAAGTGHLGDAKAEKMAGDFLVEDQLKLIGAIYRLTFPNGLAALIEIVQTFGPEAAPESKKPVRVRLKTSPSPSPALSEAVSHQTMQ